MDEAHVAPGLERGQENARERLLKRDASITIVSQDVAICNNRE